MRFENCNDYARQVMDHFAETEKMVSEAIGKPLEPAPLRKEPAGAPKGCQYGYEYGKLFVYGCFDNIVPEKLDYWMDAMRDFVMDHINNKTHCEKDKGFKSATEFRLWFQPNAEHMCMTLSFYMEAYPAR